MFTRKKEGSLFVGDKHLKLYYSKRIRQKNLILKVNKNKITISGPFYVSWLNLEKFAKENINFIKDKIINNSSNDFSNEHFLKNKKYAEQILKEEIKIISEQTNLFPKKIIIRNQTSRWGSCSSRGTISLNYRLAFIPKHLRRYVIIHELCHLKYLNHSLKFWNLVKDFCPNFKKDKKELKEIGYSLF